MSRSSNAVKMVRQLRQEENIKLRKAILKDGASEEVFEKLNTANSKYQEKLNLLNKFNSKSKQTAKVQVRENEWNAEHNRLNNLVEKLESSVFSSLQRILSQDPQFDGVLEVVTDMQQFSQSRKENQRELSNQLAEVKKMVRQSESVSSRDSILAELLLNMRASHDSNWSTITTIENQMARLVAKSRSDLFTMLHEDRLGEQDESLLSEFRSLLGEGEEEEMKILMQEWLLKVSELDDSYRESVRQRMADKLKLKLGDSGWEVEEHELFVKVFEKALLTGMARKTWVDLLQSQLIGSKKSLEEISHHEDWYRSVRAAAGLSANAEAVYVQTRGELVRQAKDGLKQALSQFREDRLYRERSSEHEQHRQELLLLLGDMRREKQERDRQLKLQEDELQRQREDEQISEMERQEKLRLARKQLVESYQAIRREREREEEEQRRRELAERDRRVKEELERNKEKVIQLTKEWEQSREESRRQRELRLQEDEIKRTALLMKIASQVPYWQSIQEVESKLDHVTAAAKAHEYLDNNNDLGRGHMPMNGFTDSNVISDSRFRLAAALRAAGIHQSQAAQAAVKQFFPRPHLAIHGIV